MSKFVSILEKARLFEKFANQGSLDKLKLYQTTIQNEIIGGINAIKKLMSSNSEAAKSETLSYLDDGLGELAGIISQLSDVNAAEIVDSLVGKLQNLSFKTSPSNAGMGFDPITTQGGNYSPSAYIVRISNFVDQLKNYINTAKTK